MNDAHQNEIEFFGAIFVIQITALVNLNHNKNQKSQNHALDFIFLTSTQFILSTKKFFETIQSD